MWRKSEEKVAKKWQKVRGFLEVMLMTWTFSYLASILKCGEKTGGKIVIWGKMLATRTFSYLASLLKCGEKVAKKLVIFGRSVSQKCRFGGKCWQHGLSTIWHHLYFLSI